ncbi:MAG: YkgJ family cysteine cluster protein [Candidatus Latescibacteria bacterium]|jgi:Fe-S-cluster containining protein|nr:YkgJ family cysteine cluster protein [Candidatus Latescibacterota bacterium]MBT4136736.1 YkgJ family cysteine cluster protein [Candidatus Latescibacterota bacterium]MBT5830919.1 YkgJ family cysteine cluster protein [Candidatus Latescibacterota bacterium]
MALEVLWDRLADVEAKSGRTCGRSDGCNGACCRPSAIGGEPGVTPKEIEVINRFLATQRDFQFYEAGRDCCKFLGEDGLCRIYAVRPIDCRVHFCKDDSFESQSNSDVSNLVEAYHSEHEAAFMETELIDSVVFEQEIGEE